MLLLYCLVLLASCYYLGFLFHALSCWTVLSAAGKPACGLLCLSSHSIPYLWIAMLCVLFVNKSSCFYLVSFNNPNITLPFQCWCSVSSLLISFSNLTCWACFFNLEEMATLLPLSTGLASSHRVEGETVHYHLMQSNLSNPSVFLVYFFII